MTDGYDASWYPQHLEPQDFGWRDGEGVTITEEDLD